MRRCCDCRRTAPCRFVRSAFVARRRQCAAMAVTAPTLFMNSARATADRCCACSDRWTEHLLELERPGQGSFFAPRRSEDLFLRSARLLDLRVPRVQRQGHVEEGLAATVKRLGASAAASAAAASAAAAAAAAAASAASASAVAAADACPSSCLLSAWRIFLLRHLLLWLLSPPLPRRHCRPPLFLFLLALRDVFGSSTIFSCVSRSAIAFASASASASTAAANTATAAAAIPSRIVRRGG